MAVDDSADSEFAVDWVINNLYQKGDDIHLLHCIPYAPTQVIPGISHTTLQGE